MCPPTYKIVPSSWGPRHPDKNTAMLRLPTWCGSGPGAHGIHNTKHSKVETLEVARRWSRARGIRKDTAKLRLPKRCGGGPGARGIRTNQDPGHGGFATWGFCKPVKFCIAFFGIFCFGVFVRHLRDPGDPSGALWDPLGNHDWGGADSWLPGDPSGPLRNPSGTPPGPIRDPPLGGPRG